ncbi:MAG TPA: acyl-CoA dehydrogenase family protein [Mycobacterium sp.]|uniref:acyl-CoA dehydrogenase family protein n=1 Tax=Mycobacterium sp. TaxID=1785 RepID=UPI002BF1EF4E|nr:acyl-CoA dehydrogenase family protein [Mycobacterium sp.]HME77216.1 acyl-CoA dehydrogenase family protein [Mycobacterium sp.]
MRLIPSQDDHDLASMLRSLLAAECPTTLARALHDPTGQRMPATLWEALADTGVLGLVLPEEHGGSGGTLPDLGIFCVEAGRALCPMVVHSTIGAALAIDMLGGAEQRAAWLPGLSSGTVCGTTALWSARDAGVITGVLRASRDPVGAWRLRGTADFVADADLADLLIISAVAASAAHPLGFVVDLLAPGVRVEPLAMLGGNRAFCVHFDDVVVNDGAAVLAGEDGAGLAEPDLRRVANAAVALLSLDLVGVGEAVLQRTVDYTGMRRQFGRPIASFQAAQHLVANMHIALAAARLAAHSAVFWIGKGRTATRETAIARMWAAAAAKQVTLDAHQLHGGIGYVLDTDLHLWSERARVVSTVGGGADVAATWLQNDIGLDGGREHTPPGEERR